MPLAWGVCVSEPQRHRLASEQLAEHDFEFFIPLREHKTVKRGRHHRVLIPYFGRYIFIALTELWVGVLALRGVACILIERENLTPLHVDPDELAAVRKLCDRRGVIRIPPIKGLCLGDVVRVDHGPLAHLRGVYDGAVGRNREAAVFAMFGGQHRALFRTGELRLALGK